MFEIIDRVLKDDQNFWNALYSIGFTILALALVAITYSVNGGLPRSIDFFDAVLLSLATFRLVRLFVYDKVTAWIRAMFNDAVDGPRKTLADLLGCPWCFGVWAALGLVFVYFVFPVAWYFILILAIAGVGSFLQLLSNLIGWKAELGKLETRSKG